MFKKKHYPRVALLEITLKCNLKCIHCGSFAGKKRKRELTTEEWIDVIHQLKKLKCKRIGLTGGEPFLHKDWYKLVKEIKKLNMELVIITNAQFIDKEVIDKIKGYDKLSIDLSLDGATAEVHDHIRGVKGTFKKCIEVMEMLRKENISITIITAVQKSNLKDLPGIRDLIVNKGICWQIQPATPFGRCSKNVLISKEEYYSMALFIATSRIKHSFKELPVSGSDPVGYHSKQLPNIGLKPWMGCIAGLDHLAIQSNGNVKGCLALNDDFIEGNVLEKSLEEIWNNPDNFSYNRKFTINDLTNECVGCKHGRTCKGGCTTFSVSLTGKPHGHPYCLYRFEESYNK